VEENPAVASKESDSERHKRQAAFGDEVISDESCRSAIAAFFVDTLDGPCKANSGGDDGTICNIRAHFGGTVCPRGSRDVIRWVLEDCEYCEQHGLVYDPAAIKHGGHDQNLQVASKYAEIIADEYPIIRS
jgi:hypothetical protein